MNQLVLEGNAGDKPAAPPPVADTQHVWKTDNQHTADLSPESLEMDSEDWEIDW